MPIQPHFDNFPCPARLIFDGIEEDLRRLLATLGVLGTMFGTEADRERGELRIPASRLYKVLEVDVPLTA